MSDGAPAPSRLRRFIAFLRRPPAWSLWSVLVIGAIGGIVFAAYDALLGVAPRAMLAHERHDTRHRFHLLAIGSAPLLFLILLALKRLNPIYAAALALMGGFVATLYCRPDLWRKMLLSGALFLALYFVVFVLFNLAFPGYVAAVWNLDALSGVSVLGVPAEELMFAFTFGLYWSSMYEHLAWRRIRRLSGIVERRDATRPAMSGERHP